MPENIPKPKPKKELLSTSQLIKQILDILDILSIPDTAKQKIKSLCWDIADYEKAVKHE